jgi:uncharacterized protein HemX
LDQRSTVEHYEQFIQLFKQPRILTQRRTLIAVSVALALAAGGVVLAQSQSAAVTAPSAAVCSR